MDRFDLLLIRGSSILVLREFFRLKLQFEIIWRSVVNVEMFAVLLVCYGGFKIFSVRG